MSFSIDGKTAIVTGAANGIGLAIARHFAEHGANVMFADMDEASLQKEVGGDSDQSNMQYFAGDLREKLTIANLLSATLDSFDRVDILINASRQMMASDLLDLNDNSVETLLNQNFMTSLRLSQLIATRMIKQSGSQTEGQAGAIVNLSSIAARRAHPQLLGYSVSTAALDQMTRAMAVAIGDVITTAFTSNTAHNALVSRGAAPPSASQAQLQESPSVSGEEGSASSSGSSAGSQVGSGSVA